MVVKFIYINEKWDYKHEIAERAHLYIQAPVVQKVDSAIRRINHYPLMAQLVYQILVHWIVISPVDSAILRLNNRAQMTFSTTLKMWESVNRSRLGEKLQT